MRAKLKSGAEIDFLTQDELHQTMQEMLSGFMRPPQTARPISSVPLNASGNSCRDNNAQTGTAAGLLFPVFKVPLGYRFRLHRATFHPDGTTFGAPFTSTTGYLDIARGDLMQSGISFASPGLPYIWSAGTADGIDYQDGEEVQILVSGGPASKTLSVRMQGTLDPYVRQ